MAITLPGGKRIEDVHQRIRETASADDYDLDDDAIEEINRLFGNYLTYQHFDVQQRGSRRGARDQLKKLAKTLDAFEREWEQATQNPYVLNAIVNDTWNPELRAIQEDLAQAEEQCKHEGKDPNEDERFVNAIKRLRKNNDEYYDPLIWLFREIPEEGPPFLKRLRDAIEVAVKLPTLDRAALRTFTPGRPPSRKPLGWLIKGLYEIACRYARPDENKMYRLIFVRELLQLLDLDLPTNTINNILLEPDTSQK